MANLHFNSGVVIKKFLVAIPSFDVFNPNRKLNSTNRERRVILLSCTKSYILFVDELDVQIRERYSIVNRARSF